MSAPWEVWGADLLGNNKWVFTDDKRVGSTSRYLRADLTCGECANNGDENKCGHLHIYTASHLPACMAFQPKEER